MHHVNNKKENAAFSLYLALMLSAMIPLVWTMIEGARVSALRMKIECTMHLVSDSVLAEYNNELLERYGLLFIDTAYKSGGASTDALLDRIRYYADKNLDTGSLPGTFAPDLTGLYLDDISLHEITRATDNKAEILKYLALSYMYEKYGAAYAADASDLVSKNSKLTSDEKDVEKDLEDTRKNIDNVSFSPPEDLEEGTEWQEPEKDDPSENVAALKDLGILSCVCKGPVSAASFSPSSYPSSRSLVKGDCRPSDWDERNSIIDRLLFNEYILLFTGRYTSEADSTFLKYETEYILYGKGNDTENLKCMARDLLLMRGSANTSTYLSSASLKEQTKAFAAALSIVTAFPELTPLYEAALSAAWIYMESLYDVSLLMSGKKVPTIKSTAEWHYSLKTALSAASPAASDQEGYKSGLDYDDYCRLLLFARSAETCSVRLTDIIELNLGKGGAVYFHMDDCIAAASVQYTFKSSYGYTFLAEKAFRYT